MKEYECKSIFERLSTMKGLIKNKKRIYLYGDANTGKKFIVEQLEFFMMDNNYDDTNIIISRTKPLNPTGNHAIVHFIGTYNRSQNNYS